MSMQDGYLTLLAYDDSLARRRKRQARRKQRKALVAFALTLAVSCVFVLMLTGGGLI